MDPKAEKICSKCKEAKPLTEFYSNKRKKDKLEPRCKVCRRKDVREYYFTNLEKVKEYHKRPKTLERERLRKRKLRKDKPEQVSAHKLKSIYGITMDEYKERLSKQGSVCAICGEKETTIDHRTDKLKALSVDHCHSSGKVRGLLCGRCNLCLGRWQDNIAIMNKA
jgi:hypothetical protein